MKTIPYKTKTGKSVETVMAVEWLTAQWNMVAHVQSNVRLVVEVRKYCAKTATAKAGKISKF